MLLLVVLILLPVIAKLTDPKRSGPLTKEELEANLLALQSKQAKELRRSRWR